MKKLIFLLAIAPSFIVLNTNAIQIIPDDINPDNTVLINTDNLDNDIDNLDNDLIDDDTSDIDDLGDLDTASDADNTDEVLAANSNADSTIDKAIAALDDELIDNDVSKDLANTDLDDDVDKDLSDSDDEDLALALNNLFNEDEIPEEVDVEEVETIAPDKKANSHAQCFAEEKREFVPGEVVERRLIHPHHILKPRPVYSNPDYGVINPPVVETERVLPAYGVINPSDYVSQPVVETQTELPRYRVYNPFYSRVNQA